MTIKSLLLGSAAVLVAVSGARAADAIVAEPEPVEYVRVCDAYGAGYFYIPGTETCIKFSGEVRVQYGFKHFHEDVADQTSLHEANVRARLRVDAKNETEYGTLASHFRMNAVSGEGGHDDQISKAEGPGTVGAMSVDQALISLAGFRLGFSDDYWSTNNGYGFYQARFDGPYGFSNGIFFDYTYAANGFAVTVGIEDGNASGESGAPDLYAGFNYSANNLTVAGTIYNDGSEGAIAWKASADYDFGNGFLLGGWYMADDGKTDYVKGHAYGIRSSYQLSETMLLFAGYGAYADQYDSSGITPATPNTTGTGCITPAPTLAVPNPAPICGSYVINGKAAVPYADTHDSYDVYTVGLAWRPVEQLLIQPEWTAQAYEDNNDNTNFGRFSLRIVRSDPFGGDRRSGGNPGPLLR
jgi:Porin subfamily